MRSTNTYGIRLCDLGLCWLGLERRDKQSWRLVELDRVPSEVLESKRLIRGVSPSLRRGAGILPGTAVKTAVVRLPRFRGKELRSAVMGWVAREEGVPAEDLAVTWRVLDHGPAAPDELLNVFLVYARQSDVAAAMALYARLELEPELLLPDFMILDAVLRELRPELADMSAWSYVHLDQTDSFVGITMNRCPLLHRALPKDLSEGADPTAYVQRLATEILRSLSFARQTEQSPTIGAIYLSGDSELTSLLAAALSEAQAVPVTTWNLFEDLDTGEETPSPRAVLLAAAAMLTSLKERPYNLLPTRHPLALTPQFRRRLGVGLATAAAVALPLLTAGALYTQHRSGQRLDVARQQLERYRPAIEAATLADQRYRLAMERESVIAAHGKTKDWDSLLLDLARRTPPQVRFESLRMQWRGETAVLQLVGESSDVHNAKAQKAFLDFLASLDSSELLTRSPLPGKLVIDEVKDQESRRKRVDFSLEYLVSTNERQEG